jgi:inhibitor of KinA
VVDTSDKVLTPTFPARELCQAQLATDMQVCAVVELNGRIDPTYTPVADGALLVEFGTAISESVHGAVRTLDAALAAEPPPWLREVVPAFVNLLVVFNPVVTDHGAVERTVKSLLGRATVAPLQPTVHTALVCYEDGFAPDLAAVAEQCGLSIDAVIDAHLDGDYSVFMYGFAPGYAYLGGVPKTIQVPRKRAAIRGISAGSVMIAGPQCLITTLTMPTGWSVIGRSPTQVLRDDPERPFLFDVGDRVAFERIDLAALDALIRNGGT